MSSSEKMDRLCRDLMDSLDVVLRIAKPASRHEALTTENAGDVLVRARASLPALAKELVEIEHGARTDATVEEVLDELQSAASSVRTALRMIERAAVRTA